MRVWVVPAVVMLAMLAGVAVSAEADPSGPEHYRPSSSEQSVMLRLPAQSIGYPKAAMNDGATGEAIVEIQVADDGRVDRILLVRSSGHEALDAYGERAVDALSRAGTIQVACEAFPCAVHVRVVFDLRQGEYVGRVEPVMGQVATQVANASEDEEQSVPARETVFRDLAWGDPVEALGEATRVESEDGADYYTKTDEELAIGTLAVQEIGYVFFGDMLMGVAIRVWDPKAAKRIITAKFGEPIEDNPFMVDASWRSGDTFVRLQEDFLTGTAWWTMMSIPISRGRERWLQEQAAKDAAMF